MKRNTYRGGTRPDPKWDDMREALSLMKELDPPLPWRCADKEECAAARSIAHVWMERQGFNVRTLIYGDTIYFVRLPSKAEKQ